MRKLLVVAVALLVSATGSGARAADNAKVSVEIVAGTEGASALAFQLKERFRSSSSFRVVDAKSEAAYHVQVLTIEGSGAVSGLVSYTAILTETDISEAVKNPNTNLQYYSTAVVGYCGANRLVDCSATVYNKMAAEIDESATAWRAAFSASTKARE